jgi:branched-chain amino acid transport system substrate-binding protein
VVEFRAFMQKYYPEGSVVDNLNVYAYAVAQTLVHVLRQSGDTLTRENVMRHATSMKDFRVDILIPGITITTGPDDYAPVEAVQLQRFNGKQWERFGDVVSGR